MDHNADLTLFWELWLIIRTDHSGLRGYAILHVLKVDWLTGPKPYKGLNLTSFIVFKWSEKQLMCVLDCSEVIKIHWHWKDDMLPVHVIILMVQPTNDTAKDVTEHTGDFVSYQDWLPSVTEASRLEDCKGVHGTCGATPAQLLAKQPCHTECWFLAALAWALNLAFSTTAMDA